MKIIGKIFAILYSIVYFFILIALMISAFSLNFLSTKYYTNVMKGIDLSTMKATDFGDFFDDIDLEENATVEEVLVTYFEEGGIDKDLALAVINNDEIREVIGKFIGDYMNYNVGGERPTIAREDVEAVFNEEDLKKLLEQSPEEMNVDIDKIYNQLNDLADEIVEGGGANYDNTERNNNNYIIN